MIYSRNSRKMMMRTNETVVTREEIKYRSIMQELIYQQKQINDRIKFLKIEDDEGVSFKINELLLLSKQLEDRLKTKCNERRVDMLMRRITNSRSRLVPGVSFRLFWSYSCPFEDYLVAQNMREVPVVLNKNYFNVGRIDDIASEYDADGKQRYCLYVMKV